MRKEVEEFTRKSILKNISLFQNTSPNFTNRIVQYLRPRRLREGEILYSQGDDADESFFVIKGGFTLYSDIQSLIEIPADLLEIDPMSESFNIPYVSYSKGGYFGDSDFISSKHTSKQDDYVGKTLGRRTIQRGTLDSNVFE